VPATQTKKLKTVLISDKVHKLLKTYCLKKGLKVGVATENIIIDFFKYD